MRIKKLQSLMMKKGIDLSLISNFDETPNTNLVYFANYKGIGYLAVTKNSCFLLVPESELDKTKDVKIKVAAAEKKKFLIVQLSERLKKDKIKKIGIEEDRIVVSRYKKIKRTLKARYADISVLCSCLRMVKEPEELDCIRYACDVTDNIYAKICHSFRFKTEEEVREFIKKEAEKNGCGLSFPPIAASGKGTSEVHYRGSKRISKGFLMLDFGVKYKGYCSDMTRMLYIGEPKKKEAELFNLVLKTILPCEENIEKNRTFGKIYQKSLRLLGEYARYFTHGLGHGLGLDIHESPSLYTEDRTKIEELIPFTIEPGIYFPGKFGIRIEDTLVLEKDDLKILTKSKKELVVIR